MQTINRQALAERIHANAVAKGFWPTNEDGTYKYSPEHCSMLVITELSEAIEADRKGRKADPKRYDSLLTHAHKLQGGIGAIYKELKAKSDEAKRPLWEIAFDCIKDSVEDELADAYIRLLDFLAGYKCTILNRYGTGVSYREEDTFTEFTHRTVGWIVRGYHGFALDNLDDYCQHHGIDLLWHIEEKMRYNESRPAKHGKEY